MKKLNLTKEELEAVYEEIRKNNLEDEFFGDQGGMPVVIIKPEPKPEVFQEMSEDSIMFEGNGLTH